MLANVMTKKGISKERLSVKKELHLFFVSKLVGYKKRGVSSFEPAMPQKHVFHIFRCIPSCRSTRETELHLKECRSAKQARNGRYSSCAVYASVEENISTHKQGEHIVHCTENFRLPLEWWRTYMAYEYNIEHVAPVLIKDKQKHRLRKLVSHKLKRIV